VLLLDELLVNLCHRLFVVVNRQLILDVVATLLAGVFTRAVCNPVEPLRSEPLPRAAAGAVMVDVGAPVAEDIDKSVPALGGPVLQEAVGDHLVVQVLVCLYPLRPDRFGTTPLSETATPFALAHSWMSWATYRSLSARLMGSVPAAVPWFSFQLADSSRRYSAPESPGYPDGLPGLRRSLI
jgi:hypothetical protein